MIQNAVIYGKVFYAKVEEKQKKDGSGSYTEIKVGYKTKEGISIFNKFIPKNSENSYVKKMTGVMDNIVSKFNAKEEIYVKWATKPYESKDENKTLKNYDYFTIRKDEEGNYNFNTSGFLDIIGYKEKEGVGYYVFTKKNGEEIEYLANSMSEHIEIEAMVEMTDGDEVIFTDGKAEYPNEVYGVLNPTIYEKVGNKFEQGSAYKVQCKFVKGQRIESAKNDDVFSFDEEVKPGSTFESDKLVFTPLGKSTLIKFDEVNEEFPF